ncbi:MAG: metallophosphoesterase [Bacteroidales bacterium]|jgi:predicted MPP superfamily phosphohydrolase|nr:metallophosphoesterase [Bacteroidales bacterium]
MKPVYFLIPLLLFLALIAYSLMRGYQTLGDIKPLKITYLVVYILLVVAFFAGMVCPFLAGVPGTKLIAFVGHTALVIIIYLVLSYFLTDIVRLANRFIHFAPDLLLRKYCLSGSIIVIITALIIGNWRFQHPEIVHLDIHLPQQTALTHPIKMVIISDLHLGISIDKDRLQEYVALINAQHPDIVCIVGDIYDNKYAPVVDQKMHEEWLQIKAPLGVYTVLGNHDYYEGNLEEKIHYLQQGGITVLKDDITLIDSTFYLLGRDDRSNKNRNDLATIMQGREVSKPVFVLDHQPYNLEEAKTNKVDVQFSGHTHGGQFFPMTLIVNSMYKKSYGYLRLGDTQYYITSGLGLWGPQYRIGSSSELVVATIR